MLLTSRSTSFSFQPRTLVVLVCLLAAMTLVSALLLALEPAPLAPGGGPVLTALGANSQNPKALEPLFATQPAPSPERWRAIVVHDSGQEYGNAHALGQKHQAQGHEGLVHHFVIGNGDGADDGEVQVGYRWVRQADSASFEGFSSAPWFNRHAISICLIGDGDHAPPTDSQMEQLVALVAALQKRLEIPADNVLLYGNVVTSARGPGLLFPVSAFRQQLLDVSPAPR